MTQMQTQTVAEQIASLFDDDVFKFRFDNGVSIRDVCQHLAERVDGHASRERYIFLDGSVLTIAGHAWCLGYPDEDRS